MFRAASLTLLGHGYDHSGQRMVKLMDQFISNSVIKYLEDNKAYMPQKARRNQLNGDELRQLDRFQSYTRKDFSRDRRGKMVTFSDLAILHRLAPEKFKLLTITGWNASLNRSEYFDAKRTPDMPIAYAVRISASLPFNFQDVIYQGSVYQDGGLGSSMPTEVFCHQDGQPTAELHARTALLDFYRNGLSFAILYSTPSLEKNSLWSRLVDKLTSVPRPRKVLKADYRKVYEGGINTFTVYESDLRPMSFNVSRKKIMNARQKAQYAMVEQLYQRRKQAYMVEYDNLKALYQDLDKNAKLALRKAGPVSEQDYPRKKDREAMENLCKQARENELACNRPIFSGLLV
jgi:predicted acylesterase/phospholipase RssA